MFWDGTRWIDERAPAATPPPSRRRARGWLATGVMIVGIVALAIPFVATSAASSSADRLMASWSGTFETRSSRNRRCSPRTPGDGIASR
jgi:hypothetical protein